MDGCIYRTKDNECDLFAEGGKYTAFCDFENCKSVRPSNGDRIRAMTDEELADYLAWITRGNGGFSPVDYKDKYFPVWLEWLKKEAEL